MRSSLYLFPDTIQLFDSYRILKETEELLAVWLYHVQLYVGLLLTVFHNLSEAGNSFQESHKKEMSEFNSLILLCQNSLLVFLERINYFSFDLCVCVQNLQVSF